MNATCFWTCVRVFVCLIAIIAIGPLPSFTAADIFTYDDFTNFTIDLTKWSVDDYFRSGKVSCIFPVKQVWPV